MEFISSLFYPNKPDPPADPIPEKTIILDTTKNKSWVGSQNGISESIYLDFLQKYRKLTKANPLTIEITTMGGDLTYALLIANILSRHPYPVICQVPKFAMSAGTLIALAGSELQMTNYATLGPIDPQVHSWIGGPVKHLRTATIAIPEAPREPSFADMFQKFVASYTSELEESYQTKIARILIRRYSESQAEELIDLFYLRYAHCIPIMVDEIPDFVPLSIYQDDKEELVVPSTIPMCEGVCQNNCQSMEENVASISDTLCQRVSKLSDDDFKQLQKMISQARRNKSDDEEFEIDQEDEEIRLDPKFGRTLNKFFPNPQSDWCNFLVKQPIPANERLLIQDLYEPYLNQDVELFTEMTANYDSITKLSVDAIRIILHIKMMIKQSEKSDSTQRRCPISDKMLIDQSKELNHVEANERHYLPTSMDIDLERKFT